MSLYSDLNTTIRKKVNTLNINYNGVTIPIYWALEHHKEKGAHVVATKETTDPKGSELGDNPDQDLSGFIQFMIKLPRTDAGLDAQLSLISGQLWNQFPISTIRDNNVKMAYNSVKEGPHLTVGGFASVTVRVNFDAFYCV